MHTGERKVESQQELDCSLGCSVEDPRRIRYVRIVQTKMASCIKDPAIYKIATDKGVVIQPDVLTLYCLIVHECHSFPSSR